MRVRLINRRQNFATAQATPYDNIFSEVSNLAVPRGIPARIDPVETAQVLRPEAFSLGVVKKPRDTSAEQTRGVASFQGAAQIITQQCAKPIHSLCAGDLVLTRDNGFQPVLWVGAISSAEATPSLVEIEPDSVCDGKPKTAICVSARQSVLLTCAGIQAQFGTAEVLARAGDLLHLEGVTRVDRASETVAILMEQHELLSVNGLWMDSMMPDGEALDRLSSTEKQSIKSLLPDLGRLPIERIYPAARTVLRPEFARQFSR